MRYIILGAGSVGCVLGSRLADAGRPVVLVGRGPHLEALQTRGLKLSTFSGASWTRRIPAVRTAHEVTLTPDDVLVLTCKSQDTGRLLGEWSARPVSGGDLAGKSLPVFCLQNGVGNERLASDLFSHVYAASLWMLAEIVEPGHVRVECDDTFGVLDLGGYPAGLDRVAAAVVEDLRTAGFLSFSHEEIMPWKFGKLLCNLSNAVQAACGWNTSEAGQTLRELIRTEALDCYRAAGVSHVDIPAAMARRGITIAGLTGHEVPRIASSSWQSLERRSGSIEVEFLNGEIVALGRLHGVPTPANALIRDVVSQLAADQCAPGSVAAEALLQLLA